MPEVLDLTSNKRQFDMSYPLDNIPYKRAIFVLFALSVFVLTTEDILDEFSSGESLVEMVDDVALLVASALIVALFGYDYISQQRKMRNFQEQLDSVRGQLVHLDSNSGMVTSQYREIMQKQFVAWSLTASEQDVVVALLKGLSFREISQLRNTKEKTVRQQAAAVYKKAGVSGRHELAAWFFEDMLDPPSF